MLAIAGTELRRFVRDRSNIFFMLIFPMLLVFVLGLQFGGGADQGRVVITGAGGELRQGLAEELERTGTEVDGVAGAEEMRTEVARERAEVGLYIDAEAESDYASGQPGQIEMIAASGAGAPMVQQRVLTALGTLTGPRAEVAALTQAGVPPQEADAALVGAREAVAPVSLTVTDAGGQTNVFAGLGRFDLEAGSMLLLFVFLSTLSSAVTLIQSRRLGVQARVWSPRSRPVRRSVGRCWAGG
ncbi:hypothetical protein [Sanguibacter sp. Z1732]|uniref:hypothetical protein n=1 Tax=Sanguibacter sp. Z1732 TaxID=3435412 RepID=UPI003D9CBAD6